MSSASCCAPAGIGRCRVNCETTMCPEKLRRNETPKATACQPHKVVLVPATNVFVPRRGVSETTPEARDYLSARAALQPQFRGATWSVSRKFLPSVTIKAMQPETGRQVVVALYVVAMAAVIVGMDFAFF